MFSCVHSFVFIRPPPIEVTAAFSHGMRSLSQAAALLVPRDVFAYLVFLSALFEDDVYVSYYW